MNDLIQQLRDAASAWRKNLLRIGKILLRMQKEDMDVDIYRQTILHNSFGMPMASSKVALRWAAGDYGDDIDKCVMLTSKIRHSILQKISTDIVEHILSGRHHRVFDPVEGRVVEKSFYDMTQQMVRRNIDAKGFKPIVPREKKQPRFRFCRAVAFEVPENGEGVIFVSTGPEPIHMHVSEQLLNKLFGKDKGVA